MKKKLTVGSKDRRRPGNADLRQLVDALKELIKARDALWSLSLLDRLFRREKISAAIDVYDQALLVMRDALIAISARAESAGTLPEAPRKYTVSVEELDVLLGRVRDLR